jgi:hypothetical protein
MSYLKFSLLSVLIFVSTEIVSGQDSLQTRPISEIRRNKYQVELGLGSISALWSNTTGGSVLFKKRMDIGELIDITSVKYYRIYSSFNTDIRLDTAVAKVGGIYNSTYSSDDYVDFELGIGFEKQFRNKMFVHYYGADLLTRINYRNDTRTYYNYSNNFNNEYTNIETRLDSRTSLGVSPFIGIKYYITKQLSFGLESGMYLSYYFGKYKETDKYYDGRENPTLLQEFIGNEIPVKGLNFAFDVLRFFTIGYSF